MRSQQAAQTPLGFDIVDGRLAPNSAEAERVRTIFRRYLELGSINALERDGVRSKRWTNKAGVEVGGGLMTRGPLQYLLRNVAYRGVTRHKDKHYPDTHPAIVEEELWAAVQAKLDAAPVVQPKSELRGEGARLERKVFDDRGNPIVPVHTNRRGRRYRYYVSRARLTADGEAGSLPRVSAGLLEQFLAERINPMLASSWMPPAEAIERVGPACEAITLSDDQIVARIAEAALKPEALSDPAVGPAADGVYVVRLPFHMRRRRGELILEGDGPAEASGRMDRALVRALVLARAWARELELGEVASIRALAKREGLCNHYTARLLPLAYLAPDLTDAILAGRQPRSVSLAALTARPLPMDWAAQRALFATAGSTAR
jgi:hypothetical protein